MNQKYDNILLTISAKYLKLYSKEEVSKR